MTRTSSKWHLSPHGLWLMLCLPFVGISPALADDEARIGSTTYATLAEAFENAAPGETVTLLKDVSVTGQSFSQYTNAAVGFVEGEGAVQSAATIQGLWTLYTLIPCIATVAAIVFLLVFYKLSSKDAEIMGKCNRGEISREEAESLLGRRY